MPTPRATARRRRRPPSLPQRWGQTPTDSGTPQRVSPQAVVLLRQQYEPHMRSWMRSRSRDGVVSTPMRLLLLLLLMLPTVDSMAAR